MSTIQAISSLTASYNHTSLLSNLTLAINANYTDSYGDNSSNISLGNRTLDDDEAILSPITSLLQFSIWYQGIHGYVSIVVCIIGIVSNIMNILVLMQKNMISSTNYILSALAVADLLTMTSYLPYAAYLYCVTAPTDTYKHPLGWTFYVLFTNKFVITCHTIAMWLTVALAVFRYIVVCHHVLGPALCNLYRAKITIAAVFVVTILFCVPNYAMHGIYARAEGGYWFKENTFVTPFHQVFNFWVFGVVLKVAPCVLLAILSSLLIQAMQQADKKRRRLKSQGKRAESERTSEHNRTTAMLVAVVLCFVITELPQGILAFLSGVDGNIFQGIYVPLGDVMDIIVLINSAVNFMLYCIMSRQFRETFKDLFLACCKKNTNKTPNGVHYTSINPKTSNTQV